MGIKYTDEDYKKFDRLVDILNAMTQIEYGIDYPNDSPFTDFDRDRQTLIKYGVDVDPTEFGNMSAKEARRSAMHKKMKTAFAEHREELMEMFEGKPIPIKAECTWYKTGHEDGPYEILLTSGGTVRSDYLPRFISMISLYFDRGLDKISPGDLTFTLDDSPDRDWSGAAMLLGDSNLDEIKDLRLEAYAEGIYVLVNMHGRRNVAELYRDEYLAAQTILKALGKSRYCCVEIVKRTVD